MAWAKPQIENKVVIDEVGMTKNILEVKYSTPVYHLFEVLTWSIWINVHL